MQTGDQLTHSQVNTPSAGNPAEVEQWYPGYNQGYLCCCDGQVQPPNPNYEFLRGTLLNRRASEPQPTEPEFYSSGNYITPDSLGSWTKDRQVSVYINQVGDPSSQHNKLWLGVFWRDPANPMKMIFEPPYSVVFPGSGVPQCAPCGRGSHAAKTKTASRIQTVPAYVDARPVDRHEGWLKYGNLAVDNTIFGSRLMNGDQPLRASTLSVTASNVVWRHGQRPRLVTRALGHVTAASIGWAFPGSPQAALIVWQGDISCHNVVASECRERADVFSLDPTQDIYVQVNSFWLDMLTRYGGFDLEVKVVG